MYISERLKNYLNEPYIQDLINNGDFEDLFWSAMDEFGVIDTEIFDLINIIRMANIDHNLENHIPKLLKVANKVIGKKCKFLGLGEIEDDEDTKEYINQPCTITNINEMLDIRDVYDKGTDKQLFDTVDWDIEFDDGVTIENVSGYYLDAGKLIS